MRTHTFTIHEPQEAPKREDLVMVLFKDNSRRIGLHDGKVFRNDQGKLFSNDLIIDGWYYIKDTIPSFAQQEPAPHAPQKAQADTDPTGTDPHARHDQGPTG